jgi:hypothetical protein
MNALLRMICSRWLVARPKSRRRREETLAFSCFSEEMNEARDFDSYKIGFLYGLLGVPESLSLKMKLIQWDHGSDRGGLPVCGRDAGFRCR